MSQAAGPPLPSLLSGFEGLPWIGSHPWAYPLLESVHIAGIALLLGSLVVLELRVWGASPAVPPEALARLALPVSLTGFAVVLLSGVLMFAAQPAELLANRAFLIKLGLVQLAALNAAWFHARGGLRRLDGLARAQTAASLGIWLAAIISGRWIGYL